MRSWMGELFPNSRTQVQGGNTANGSLGQAFYEGQESFCQGEPGLSGETGDGTRSWDTAPLAPVKNLKWKCLHKTKVSPCSLFLLSFHNLFP